MAGYLHERINNAFFRQMLFILVLIAIGVVLFTQLKFFIGSLLGAITLYVVFRGLLFRLTERWGWRKWIAAIVLVFFNALMLLAAGYFLVRLVAAEIPSFDTSQIVVAIKQGVEQLRKAIGFNIIPDNLAETAGGYAGKAVTTILNTTYSFAVNVFLMLVILYFMFAGGRRMECHIYRYIPFKGRSLSLLKLEIKNMIFSNAVGIPLIMAGQALAAALIYWLMGLNNIFLWGFLTGVCGLIPLVGTGLIYVPVAIFLMANGNPVGGVIVILYGLLVIANVDNVIRIVVMNKYADTHPLIVVFGVILGLPLFGFWGIIFGPLFLSGFLLLVKIYYVEYGLLMPLKDAEALAAGPTEDHPEAAKPDKGVHKLHAVKAVRAVRSIKGKAARKAKEEKEKTAAGK